MPKCWLGTPHLDLPEQALGVEEVVPEEPTLHLVMLGLEMGMVVFGNPPSPSQKDDLLVIPIRIPAPWWFSPRCWLRIAGGCMQLTECNLLAEILHWLMQFLVCEVAKLYLEVMQSAPTQVRVTSGWMRFTLPLWGWRSWFRRVSSHYGNIHPYVVLQRSHGLNGNGLILQFCCLYGTMGCLLYILYCMEQNHWFHHQILKHTQGVSVPQCHTYFYNVLLWHRGDIKQSAIFPCHYKYAYSSFKVGIIR